MVEYLYKDSQDCKLVTRIKYQNQWRLADTDIIR